MTIQKKSVNILRVYVIRDKQEEALKTLNKLNERIKKRHQGDQSV